MAVSGQHYCALCRRNFKRRFLWRRHMDTVHAPNDTHIHVCMVDGCKKGFKRKDVLERHKSNQHGISKVECPNCGKYFRKDALPNHQRGAVCQFDASLRRNAAHPPNRDQPRRNDSPPNSMFRTLESDSLSNSVAHTPANTACPVETSTDDSQLKSTCDSPSSDSTHSLRSDSDSFTYPRHTHADTFRCLQDVERSTEVLSKTWTSAGLVLDDPDFFFPTEDIEFMIYQEAVKWSHHSLPWDPATESQSRGYGFADLPCIRPYPLLGLGGRNFNNLSPSEAKAPSTTNTAQWSDDFDLNEPSLKQVLGSLSPLVRSTCEADAPGAGHGEIPLTYSPGDLELHGYAFDLGSGNVVRETVHSSRSMVSICDGVGGSNTVQHTRGNLRDTWTWDGGYDAGLLELYGYLNNDSEVRVDPHQSSTWPHSMHGDRDGNVMHSKTNANQSKGHLASYQMEPPGPGQHQVEITGAGLIPFSDIFLGLSRYELCTCHGRTFPKDYILESSTRVIPSTLIQSSMLAEPGGGDFSMESLGTCAYNAPTALRRAGPAEHIDTLLYHPVVLRYDEAMGEDFKYSLVPRQRPCNLPFRPLMDIWSFGVIWSQCKVWVTRGYSAVANWNRLEGMPVGWLPPHPQRELRCFSKNKPPATFSHYAALETDDAIMDDCRTTLILQNPGPTSYLEIPFEIPTLVLAIMDTCLSNFSLFTASWHWSCGSKEDIRHLLKGARNHGRGPHKTGVWIGTILDLFNQTYRDIWAWIKFGFWDIWPSDPWPRDPGPPRNKILFTMNKPALFSLPHRSDLEINHVSTPHIVAYWQGATSSTSIAAVTCICKTASMPLLRLEVDGSSPHPHAATLNLGWSKAINTPLLGPLDGPLSISSTPTHWI